MVAMSRETPVIKTQPGMDSNMMAKKGVVGGGEEEREEAVVVVADVIGGEDVSDEKSKGTKVNIFPIRSVVLPLCASMATAAATLTPFIHFLIEHLDYYHTSHLIIINSTAFVNNDTHCCYSMLLFKPPFIMLDERKKLSVRIASLSHQSLLLSFLPHTQTHQCIYL